MEPEGDRRWSRGETTVRTITVVVVVAAGVAVPGLVLVYLAVTGRSVVGWIALPLMAVLALPPGLVWWRDRRHRKADQ